MSTDAGQHGPLDTEPLEGRTGPRGAGMRWRVAVALLLTWLGPFTVDAYSPSLPTLVAEFGVSRSTIQLTLTAVLLGMAAGQLLAGPLSDVVGRRRPVLFALLGYVAASLLCMVAWHIWVLIGARLLQGACAATGLVIARAIGRDSYDGRPLARFYSHLLTATAIAPMIGPVLGAYLMEVFSWRAIFAMIALLGLAIFGCVALRLPETLPERPVRRSWLDPLRAYRSVLARPHLPTIALMKAAVSGAMMSYLAGASFILQETYGLTAQEYGVVFAVSMVGLIAGNQLNATLVRWLHPATILGSALAGTLLTGIGLAVAFTAGADRLWVAFTLFVLLLACYGCAAPNVLWLGMATARRDSGTTAAVLGVSQHLAGAVCAPITGAFGAVALPMAYTVIVCTALCLVVYVAIRRHLYEVGVSSGSAPRDTTPG
ncbi:multidrug effflux MFS transporter [Jiangella asiatica]|uniref:Bcr/CflA family efflux MFS transporter n=1 Tax=Jiangella asiatica TaxID=2530372 RepID=A0A4R5DT28_9ACTN|nr:multidrug effflux MFS transporter [Jiangella asiatica]TDE14285.1 Bcr/CflA family efflux MFS transporter [Jiangella asiatica]